MSENVTTQLTHNLLTFIDQSPTMFHTVATSQVLLEQAGFTYLSPQEEWTIQKNGKYYTTSNDSSLIAFCVHSTAIEEEGFKIVATHGDVPGFRIKPNAQMKVEGYIKLNTEVYGGPILSTWFDRPLSIAGRVSCKSANPLKPCTTLVDLKRPLVIIPNLAIHMNREVNNGFNINKQKDTLPILSFLDESVDYDLLLTLISKELAIPIEDILDADLFLYPFEKGIEMGLNNEWVSSPRLDDLSMSYSSLHALLNSESGTGITLWVCFDNEEVGSRTKQGADAPFLAYTLERILYGLGKKREGYLRTLSQSFMISADVAHLLHPNYTEKSDPTNKLLPGKGPAIKMNANFSYTTDSDSFSVFASLCQSANIPYQVFVNRSDEKGGSTIGPVATSHLGIRCVDIGTPMLSMHSARELMAKQDFIYTCDILKAFFSL